MKRLTLTIATLAAAVAAVAAAPARAADAGKDGRDFYVGGTLGFAAIAPRDVDVDRNRDGDGKLSPGLFAGARLGTLPIGQGWPINAEIGYQRIASHRIPYQVAGTTTDLTAKGHTYYLAGKLDIPFTERFGMYTKLGVARSKVDGSTPPGRPVIDIDGSATGLLAGVGLQYAWDNGLALRGELTSFGRSSSKSDAGAFNVGLTYRF